MIVVALSGGLGNQMFQYAAARALALQKKKDLFVDVRWYEKNPMREYELAIFEASPEVASEKEFGPFNRLKGKSIQAYIYQNIFGYTLVKESGFSFQPIDHKIKNHAYLSGYWQSEKYFKDFESEIRKDFQFRHEPVEANKELINEVQSVNSVSIHIRRGDYISDPKTNQFHGICDLTYYKNAVGFFESNFDNPKFYLFSDDQGWVKKEFDFIKNRNLISHNGNCAYEDMRLMSNCKHNIIANSSFSWWAAWLNKHKDKTIIAPKVWFASPEAENKDILPETWITL